MPAASVPRAPGCRVGVEFLGIRLVRARNEQGGGERIVSSYVSAMAVLALATNEELIVARRAYRLLTSNCSLR